MAAEPESSGLILVMVAVMLSAAGSACARQTAEEERAKRILRATGVKGGLVVHLGCDEGRLTAGLRASESYRVHGLDRDVDEVQRARRYLRSRGLYGPVSVEKWDGEGLPYVDDLVNLIVCEGPLPISPEEAMRVLVPRGVAYFQQDGRWVKRTKPWPRAIDDWTHYLHDSTGNAVAEDSEVGPPRHMHWVGSPLYSRSHEFNSSTSAAVSSHGRLFYIQDEGVIGIPDERFPAQWSLIARDAFNGTVLWKRSMGKWGYREWHATGLWSTPMTLPRRLVAVEDRVYVTFGYQAPLTVLDAATGETIRVCEDTSDTDEIVCAEDTVVLRVRDIGGEGKQRRHGGSPGELLMGIDGREGEELWRHDAKNVVPLTLAAHAGQVVYHNREEVVCLDLQTGEELWRTPSQAPGGPRGTHGTLVMYDGVVLYTSGSGLQSYSADTGELLWTGPRIFSTGAAQPPDLFVARGLVWPYKTNRYSRSFTWEQRAAACKGLNPLSGDVEDSVSVSHLITPGHHYRCYRSKATERYVLLPKRGVEFLDLAGSNHMRHDWLRAPCSYGVLPCNGMLYMAPHQCFCYPGVKLAGFNALTEGVTDGPGSDGGHRIARGPAWGTKAGDTQAGGEDWPTYRHDRRRSGRAGSEVSSQLVRAWDVKVGEEITPPVMADGRLYVAEKDAHTVHCLDSTSGDLLWRFTVAGRVDSPPTIHGELVLFGCADGCVYCLRAADGKLVWRFRAAPGMRRVAAFQQVECAWPVHGSVLLQDGVVYCSAGRSSYLDGGISLYGLDPETGKIIHETVLESERPDIHKESGRPFDVEGARSDILVSDGTDIYLYQVRLNPDLTRQETPRITRLGDRKMGLHLMCTGGFLDTTWCDRMYWSYSRRWPGYYFANNGPKVGKILVFDNENTYGAHVFTERARLSPMFRPGKGGVELFADDNSNEPILKPKHEGREKGPGYSRANPPKWSSRVPVLIRGMVLAGDNLFVAGPPDEVPEDNPLAAFQGELGSRLRVHSKTSGEKLAEYELDEVPVFDGLIAAGHRLYMSTDKGRLVCWREK